MMPSTIAGHPVQAIDRSGRRYVYPPDYPNLSRIEHSIELSASHDDGDVEGLKVDPDLYAAQDAYFSGGPVQSPAFIKSMAEIIDPRFDALFHRALEDDATVSQLHRIGQQLASGGNVINAVPHGPLLDIGLMHAMAYLGLNNLGYDFRIGIVISHGVAGRGKRFGDSLVCLADALDWACDKTWYVTPQTPKTRQSSYAEVVSGEHIRTRNAVVRADIADELDTGGMLITIAPSATSIRTDGQGNHWVEVPTLGTMKLMAHPKTIVAIAVGKVLGTETPGYAIAADPMQLPSDAEGLTTAAHQLATVMAEGMHAIDANGEYRVGRR